MSDFTHFNEQGRAKMVDVGEKPISQRTAVAAGLVLVNETTFNLIKSGGMKAELEKAIWNKPQWHGNLDAVNRSKAGRNMNQIGG